MSLKGGHVSDFDKSLAAAIEQALVDEWLAVKGQSLPAQGQDDRRLLFVAIAQGVLRYLKAHQNEILTSLTFDAGAGSVTASVSALDLDVAG
jgi:O-methyltransferase involved in polyketide biosynthesis